MANNSRVCRTDLRNKAIPEIPIEFCFYTSMGIDLGVRVWLLGLGCYETVSGCGNSHFRKCLDIREKSGIASATGKFQVFPEIPRQL